MTHPTVSPPLRRLFPLFLIIFLLLTPGCGLLGGTQEPEPTESGMTLEEALQTTPLDGRPTVLEELGPPDAFTIQFKELEGQIVRWESWSYFDFTTQFDFIDGELIWRIDIEPVPDGSFYAHFYDPLELQAGMSQAEVEALFPEIDFWEIPLDALDMEDGIALAGEQIFLGFYQDELVYVETVILSPSEDGKLLDFAESSPTEEIQPTQSEPTPEPQPLPTETAVIDPILLQDYFESDTAQAIPLFGEAFMEYGNIDGVGALTTHFPGGILLAYYSQPVRDDFILEVEIQPLSFAEDAKAGILFRSENPVGGADYYNLITIKPSSQQIWLEVWKGGVWAVQESRDIPPDLIPQYGVYKLKIDCQGQDIKVYLRDKVAAEFSSDLILDPGHFGFSIISSQDPETVLFDKLVITEHP